MATLSFNTNSVSAIETVKIGTLDFFKYGSLTVNEDIFVSGESRRLGVDANSLEYFSLRILIKVMEKKKITKEEAMALIQANESVAYEVLDKEEVLQLTEFTEKRKKLVPYIKAAAVLKFRVVQKAGESLGYDPAELTVDDVFNPQFIEAEFVMALADFFDSEVMGNKDEEELLSDENNVDEFIKKS